MPRNTLIAALLLTSAGCATNRAATPTVTPEVGQQMRATYTCVVDAIAEAGYPVAAEEGKLTVIAHIRQELAPNDQSLQEPRTGGSGYGTREKAEDAGTPYSVDGVQAIVALDRRTGRIVVETEGYTGAALTRKSGYVKRPASARGNLAMKNARACAPPQTSAE